MLPHVGDLMWIQSPGPETGSYSGFPAPYGGLPPPDGSYGGLPPPDGEAYGNGHAPLATSYDANSPSPPPPPPPPPRGGPHAVRPGRFRPPPPAPPLVRTGSARTRGMHCGPREVGVEGAGIGSPMPCVHVTPKGPKFPSEDRYLPYLASFWVKIAIVRQKCAHLGTSQGSQPKFSRPLVACAQGRHSPVVQTFPGARHLL